MAGSSGETDLKTLLASMQPVLSPTPYVYVCIPASVRSEEVASLVVSLSPIATVQEEEGLTLVLPQSTADEHNSKSTSSSSPLKLEYSYVASRITLKVHSSLEAVGLTAAFATRLGRNGISANVVAGFYHDHLFVAQKDGDKAVALLKELAEEARRSWPEE